MVEIEFYLLCIPRGWERHNRARFSCCLSNKGLVLRAILRLYADRYKVLFKCQHHARVPDISHTNLWVVMKHGIPIFAHLPIPLSYPGPI